MKSNRRTGRANNSATVGQSGNASIFVYVDTSAMGYSYLAGLHARGELNDLQFLQAIKDYKELLEKDAPRAMIGEGGNRTV